MYLSYGSAVTPPGSANFTLSAQPNNQNNPNVEPQKSRNYEVGGKIGLYDNRLSLSLAAFRTDNENVIFTVDAAAIPPVFNQDDRQRVNGFTIGSLGRITPRAPLAHAYRAGAWVAAVRSERFELQRQIGGGQTLLRVTAAGAREPLAASPRAIAAQLRRRD